MKRLSSRPIIITIIVVLILFVLDFFNLLVPIKRGFFILINPIEIKVYEITAYVKNYFTEQSDYQALKKEYKTLKKEKENLLKDNIKLKLLVRENEILKKELGFIEEKHYKYVLGRIMGLADVHFSNSLIFNKGSKDGVRKGLAVVSHNGMIIGKIIKVENDFSVILLLTDNNSRVAATILNMSQSAGIVKGKHGLGIVMDFIPQNEEVKVGDIVATSGQEDGIPPGLIIGQIEKNFPKKAELFQNIVIKPLIPYTKLSLAFIIIPDNKQGDGE